MQKLTATIDNVIFTIRDNELHVLMVRRATSPFVGQWALPGGAVDTDKDADSKSAASRILKLKTGLNISYLEQLKTYIGNFDPRGYTVSVAHFALTRDADLLPKVDSVHEAKWVPVSMLKDLQIAFIHEEIINDAIVRLQQKSRYSLIPLYCLPRNFTVPELCRVLSVILGREVARMTVHRRIDKMDEITKLEGTKSTGKSGRSGTLYTANKPIDQITFDRNLVD